MATPKCTPRIDFGAAFEVGRGLEGKSAIVTGAGSGIGESIVRALAEAGYVFFFSFPFFLSGFWEGGGEEENGVELGGGIEIWDLEMGYRISTN